MGFTMTNGKDMTSVMYRMDGEPIFEQTLGSADAMLLRLLAGDETVGGEKQPYDPRIHFVLINEAYKAANPGNTELAKLAGRAARDLRQDLWRQAPALPRGLQQAEGSDQALGQHAGGVGRRRNRARTAALRTAHRYEKGPLDRRSRGLLVREVCRRPGGVSAAASGCSRLACPSGPASPRS